MSAHILQVGQTTFVLGSWSRPSTVLDELAAEAQPLLQVLSDYPALDAQELLLGSESFFDWWFHIPSAGGSGWTGASVPLCCAGQTA